MPSLLYRVMIANSTGLCLFQANTFRKTSRQVHRKYFWKNIKMTLCLVAVVLIVLLALILIILFSTGVLPAKSGDNHHDSDSSTHDPTTA